MDNKYNANFKPSSDYEKRKLAEQIGVNKDRNYFFLSPKASYNIITITKPIRI